MDEKDLRLSLRVGSATNLEEWGATKKRPNQEGDDRATEVASNGEEDGRSKRKKLQLGTDQAAILIEFFNHNKIPNKMEKIMLASKCNISLEQVGNWFQNRRSRKRPEDEFERLRQRCNYLEQEVQRLEREKLEWQQHGRVPHVTLPLLGSFPTVGNEGASCEDQPPRNIE